MAFLLRMTSTSAACALLSERETAVLRLLANSHDAKSMARELGLSVHTVNEYLRSARRKLGVSSSREAARLLSAEEAALPNYAVDSEIGVAGPVATDRKWDDRTERRFTARHLAFAVGGTFAMSLVIATALFTWFTGSPATGPLSNWSNAASAPRSKTVVMNRVHLDGQSLLWNGMPISELQARQYLDITTQMSPQPLLVFSTSKTATEAGRHRARDLIDERLKCTPSLCLEIVAPAA